MQSHERTLSSLSAAARDSPKRISCSASFCAASISSRCASCASMSSPRDLRYAASAAAVAACRTLRAAGKRQPTVQRAGAGERAEEAEEEIPGRGRVRRGWPGP
eukprot:6720558-Prymnesium_polylepis.1